METTDDIGAKVSIALNQFNDIPDTETRTSVALVTEIVDRLLAAITEMGATVELVCTRVDALERRLNEHVCSPSPPHPASDPNVG